MHMEASTHTKMRGLYALSDQILLICIGGVDTYQDQKASIGFVCFYLGKFSLTSFQLLFVCVCVSILAANKSVAIQWGLDK